MRLRHMHFTASSISMSRSRSDRFVVRSCDVSLSFLINHPHLGDELMRGIEEGRQHMTILAKVCLLYLGGKCSALCEHIKSRVPRLGERRVRSRREMLQIVICKRNE